MVAPVTLQVELEHDDGVLRAQSWLRGCVVVRVEEPLISSPKKPLGILKLHMIGKETIIVTRPCSVTGCIPLSPAHCDLSKEHVVFEEHRVIRDFVDETLPDGSHSFPFSIYLPGSLPASMTFEDVTDGGCAIEYYIHAYLDEVSFSRTVKIIGRTLSKKLHTYCDKPVCFPLHFGGFRDKGFLILGTRIENTHVGKDQDLLFSVACRNKSRDDIRRVDVRLFEEIKWKCMTSHPREVHVVLAIYRDLLLPALHKEANGNSTTSHVKHVVDPLTAAEMHNDLCSPQNVAQLKIPARACDTYEGTLVSVHHSLEITLVMKDKPSDPHVRIPITIFDLPMKSCIPQSPANILAPSENAVKPVDATWLMEGRA